MNAIVPPESAAPGQAMTASGAEVLLRALREQGVDTIFGYPGGAVLPIYDALFQQDSAYATSWCATSRRRCTRPKAMRAAPASVGVRAGHQRPGRHQRGDRPAGCADGFSIPLVCLTGQVPTHLIGNDAFQEADTTGITRPATKHNYLVKRSEDLARTVHDAFYVARSGRPGPVVVDLPKDILIAPAPYVAASSKPHRSYRPRTDGRTPRPYARRCAR